MGKRTRRRGPPARSAARAAAATATTATPSWRRPALFAALVLLGGAPIAWACFNLPSWMALHLGPFYLLPLMLWPGVLATALGGLPGAGWRPPSLAGTLLPLAYPLVLLAVVAGLAIGAGLATPTEGASISQVAREWGLSLLGSFAGALFTVLGEEIGWRGFLQRRMEGVVGPARALLLASLTATAFHAFALFAAPMRAHGPAGVASFLGSVLLLQVALGLLYRVSGSLWSPFLMHLVWNATNPVLTGDVYGGQAGLLSGTLWVVNGEGLLGAAASVLLLVPLFLVSRRLAARAPPAWSRRALWAWTAVGLALVGAGAWITLRQRDAAAAAAVAAASDAGATTGRPTPRATTTTARATAPAPLRRRARAAVERALDNLASNKANLSVDAVFLLRLIQGALPGSRAGALAEAGMPAARLDPTFGLFEEILKRPWKPTPRRALPGGKVEGTPNPHQAFDEKFSDTCLNGALRCTWAPGCRAYKTRLGQWGYVLSHQVLFFVFAKEKKCRWDVDIDRFLGHLCQAMLVEQRADPEFRDLFAERMGLGIYAGFHEFLRPEWIETILRAQQPSGCWLWKPDDDACSDHTTGMAAWVLALFLASQPS